MTLKKLYNAAICGIIALLVIISTLLWSFNALLTKSTNLNNNGMELVELSNGVIHVNNHLVKLMRIFVITNESAIINEYDSILNDPESLNGKLDKMLEIGLSTDEEGELNNILSILDELAAIEETALNALDNNDIDTAISIIYGKEYENTDTLLEAKTLALVEKITNRVKLESQDIQGQLKARIVFVIIFVTISVIGFVALQLLQRKRVLIPLEQIHAVAGKVSKGEVDVKLTKIRSDEIGDLFDQINMMIDGIYTQCEVLERIASGDLTVDIISRSEKDVMNRSLNKVANDLNEIFSSISSGAAQVATGSKQISDGAQILAQSANAQTSTIDSLSDAVSTMALQTKENTNMSAKAATLADTIKEDAKKGSDQMNRMIEAVNEINTAGHTIERVVKIIDDIAFQTNILALNAAVEAARAGEHGKGFAVVAEEVRNLASKSAEAANDITALISGTVEKTELGSRIAGETAESLNDIILGIEQSNVVVGDIAKSSELQNQSIIKINHDIKELARIVQTNSAATEESAAASEEMSGQSEILHSLIAQFKLKDDFTTYKKQQSISSKRKAPKTLNIGYDEDNEFGKY